MQISGTATRRGLADADRKWMLVKLRLCEQTLRAGLRLHGPASRKFTILPCASPDAASIHWHHGLPGLAPERFAELRHVLHHAIYTKLARGVRVSLHLQSDLLRPCIPTPALRMSKEKLLDRRVAILLLIQIDVLSLGIRQERNESQPQAAIVGRILAQRQLAIDFDVIHRAEIAIFFYRAVRFFFKLLSVFRCPPVGKIAVPVKLSPLIVEPVG